MTTTLLADLSEYKDLTKQERKSCTEPIEEMSFDQNIKETLLNTINSFESNLSDLENMDGYIRQLLDSGENDTEKLKSSFADIIANLHPAQVSDNKITILTKDNSSIMFIHMWDAEGVIRKQNNLSVGQRLDTDNIVSCCLLKNVQGESSDFYSQMYTDSKTIKKQFSDPSSVSESLENVGEPIYLSVNRNGNLHNYYAKIEIPEYDFEEMYLQNNITFEENTFKLNVSGNSEEYSLNYAVYYSKQVKNIDSLRRLCKLKIKYDVLEEERIYRGRLKTNTFFEAKFEVNSKSGDRIYTKKNSEHNKPNFRIFTTHNNKGVAKPSLIEKIIASILNQNTQIYFVPHQMKLNPLKISSGENEFCFLNAKMSNITQKQKDVLNGLYKRAITKNKSTNIRNVYAYTFLLLLSKFCTTTSDARTSASKSLEQIIKQSNIKISDGILDEHEGDLIEYKLGVKVLEDIHPNDAEKTEKQPNMGEILSQCESKLSDSERGVKLILWGVDERKGILGLNDKKIEKAKGFTPERNLTPDSDYLGELKKRGESDYNIDNIETFKIYTDDTFVLATLLFES